MSGLPLLMDMRHERRRLAAAEVIDRRRAHAGHLQASRTWRTRAAADGFQPGITYCARHDGPRAAQSGCGLRVYDVRLPALRSQEAAKLLSRYSVFSRSADPVARHAAPDKSRWSSTSENLRPGLRDLLQERDIGLGVIGRRVDALDAAGPARSSRAERRGSRHSRSLPCVAGHVAP